MGTQAGSHGRLYGPAKPLTLDAVALALIVLASQVAIHGGPQDRGGVFAEPLPAALIATGAFAAIAAGSLAALAVYRDPLRSRSGGRATQCALVSALISPLICVPVVSIAWLLRIDLPAGWAQPVVPVWMVATAGAVVFGTLAPEPRRRGLLLLPVVVGAYVLTYWLGEIFDPS